MADDGVSPAVSFCPACGQSIERFEGARYCPHCGGQLESLMAPSSPKVETAVDEEEDEQPFGAKRVWPWWVAVALGLGLMFAEPADPDAPTTLELVSSDLGVVIVVVASVRLFFLRRRRRKAEDAYLRGAHTELED